MTRLLGPAFITASAFLLSAFTVYASVVPDLPQPSPATHLSLVPPVVVPTPAPHIEARAVRDLNITIGFARSFDEWVPWTCNSGLYWTENSDYGRCCATQLAGKCLQISGCAASNVLEFENGSKLTCTSTEYPACVSDIVLSDQNDKHGRTRVICDQTRFPMTFYHSILDTSSSDKTTSSGSSSSTSSSQTTSTSSSSTSSRSGEPTPGGGSAGDPEGQDDDGKKKKKSNAWIAGAVVGGIGGFGLAFALAWFILARRRRPEPAAGTDKALPGDSGSDGPPLAPPPPVQYQHPASVHSGSHAPFPSQSPVPFSTDHHNASELATQHQYPPPAAQQTAFYSPSTVQTPDDGQTKGSSYPTVSAPSQTSNTPSLPSHDNAGSPPPPNVYHNPNVTAVNNKPSELA